uniref:Uncharacterized protein n=1 Tax=Anguilla anguilla TaxID=7936 RepID=A0A0E9XVA8_ANGAN
MKYVRLLLSEVVHIHPSGSAYLNGEEKESLLMSQYLKKQIKACHI